MDDRDFQLKLNGLMAEIGIAGVPITERRRGCVDAGNLQRSIDFLRLSIKYMLFDLEATQRENRHLRRLLEADAG